MTPYYQDDTVTLYHGRCEDVLPTLEAGSIDLVLTDPPYLNDDTRVPISGRRDVPVRSETVSVGVPWGYSLDWIDSIRPRHWVVFANYRMLGGLCTRLEADYKLGCVFTWRKVNAPSMARPVPRLDCEFIIWARSAAASCERMGNFKSMVLDVPMPQAGYFAKERLTVRGGGKALHPTQKPIGVVLPFIDRLRPATVVDPFAGTGTTLVAAKMVGARAIGIELEERYCEIAARRLQQSVLPLEVARFA